MSKYCLLYKCHKNTDDTPVVITSRSEREGFTNKTILPLCFVETSINSYKFQKDFVSSNQPLPFKY